MSPLLANAFGLVFLLVGLGYLYRPNLMARLIIALRETVLNDSHIALERKKWGLFFLLLSLLSFYFGVSPLFR